MRSGCRPRKLETDIKPAVMQVLATYAYLDYCRSAASVKPCECCSATGFIDAEVFTLKSCFGTERPGTVTEIKRLDESLPENVSYQKRDTERVLCPECKGKCVVSSACRDCKGRGRAVMGNCKRCTGRGYRRMPSSTAFRAINVLVPELTQSSWSRNWKPFFEKLVAKCEIEESHADLVFQRITRA